MTRSTDELFTCKPECAFPQMEVVTCIGNQLAAPSPFLWEQLSQKIIGGEFGESMRI